MELVFDKLNASVTHCISAEMSEDEWKSAFYELFDHPEYGETNKEGLLYQDAASWLTKIAFDKLGWHDVTVSFHGISVNGNEIILSQSDEDMISDYLRLQLSRDDYSMYFYS